MDNYDYCYECGGYGDDYHLDENGEWVSSCPGCPYNTLEGDYEDECRMFIKRQHENKTKEQPWCTSEKFHPEECNTNEL